MPENVLENLYKGIRNIPDFPQKGILFRDITTLLQEPNLLRSAVDIFTDYYKGQGITKVVGIESRGFILGSVLAYTLQAGFVIIRKKGKLPAATFSKKYELEYGMDEIEIHQDALNKDDVVLFHDDLLATGGTANAAIALIQDIGVRQIEASFLCELTDLKGRERLPSEIEVFSLLKF